MNSMASAERMDDVTSLRIRTPPPDLEHSEGGVGATASEYIFGRRLQFASSTAPKAYNQIVEQVQKKYRTAYGWMTLISGLLLIFNVFEFRASDGQMPLAFIALFGALFLYASCKTVRPTSEDLREMLEHELTQQGLLQQR